MKNKTIITGIKKWNKTQKTMTRWESDNFSKERIVFWLGNRNGIITDSVNVGGKNYNKIKKSMQGKKWQWR